MSYGAVRPGFNTPVGREMFGICENWIGDVFGCVCLGCLPGFLSLFLFKYKKQSSFIKLISACVILHIF